MVPVIPLKGEILALSEE